MSQVKQTKKINKISKLLLLRSLGFDLILSKEPVDRSGDRSGASTGASTGDSTGDRTGASKAKSPSNYAEDKANLSATKSNMIKSQQNHTQAVDKREEKERQTNEQTYKAYPKQIDDIFSKSNQSVIAKNLANSAKTIEQLQENLKRFEGCSEIRNFANSTVFFEGNLKSKLLIIGEAPGSHEDQLGKPFVGQSGQLLALMLKSIGINSRKEYLISNTVFWRPPGNRTPTDLEIASCFPFVYKLIELSSAKIILTLGRSASKQILSSLAISETVMSKENLSKYGLKDFSMREMRGQTYPILLSNKRKLIIMPTFHPSYLLRDSSNKAIAYQDMLKLKQKLNDCK